MRVIVKYGGTSLANDRRIERAADAVADLVSAGHEVAVVASAMGDATDRLLSNVSADAAEATRDEVVSMGERTSVRMLQSYLDSGGVDARFLEPGNERWPVVVGDDGSVVTERTRERAETLATELGDWVPVVTGYLAESDDGDVTTLGRGGSDTTAVLLGNYMDADAVVIVTDVWGILTGDPRLVDESKTVDNLSVGEVRDLSLRGAEVVASDALDYKADDMDLRVVHYESDDLFEGGTGITGEFDRVVTVRDTPLTGFTVAGGALSNRPGALRSVLEALEAAEAPAKGLVEGTNSVTVYVPEARDDAVQKRLHECVKDHDGVSSVTNTEQAAAVHAVQNTSADDENAPEAVSGALLDSDVPVFDLTISPDSMTGFVDWDAREAAAEVLRSSAN